MYKYIKKGGGKLSTINSVYRRDTNPRSQVGQAN